MRILICDDDLGFAEQLRKDIRAILRKISTNAVIYIFESRKEISDKILSSCDIAFLDIDFSNREYNGLDIARALRSSSPKCVIVFVTNYIEYAPEGYEVQAFRYLMKTELSQKLEHCICQAVEKCQRENETFSIKVSGENVSFPLNNILYIVSQGHHVEIIMCSGTKTHTMPDRIYASISTIEEQLKDRGFLRVHKSYLVNMQHIQKFQCQKLILNNGQVLPVSEKNYSEQKKKYLLWKGIH